MGLRVGCGFDVHRFGGPGPLMLGTIALDHEAGLMGHSDGDVVAHAICDALLAAAGAEDIGHHFPPGEPRWEGAPGALLLELTLAELRRRGLEPVNAHAVVICEAPRIAPHRERMSAALTVCVGAPVSIHATTTDGLGFTGRGEGIAAQAVALVQESP
jgi:2-C-methyl-D-erythritol 2,4-cyclodiphosphate synthase